MCFKNQFEVTSGVKLSRLNVLCWPLVNVEAASSVCFSIHVSDTETFWAFQTEHDADNVLRMNEEQPVQQSVHWLHGEQQTNSVLGLCVNLP